MMQAYANYTFDRMMMAAKEEEKKAEAAKGDKKDEATPKNATKAPVDYAKMVDETVNWYESNGKTPMDKLKDDTPFAIKSHPMYKKLAKRFMAGKFKDEALEKHRNRFIK